MISHFFSVQVVLTANDLPSINDVTYLELIEILSKVIKEIIIIRILIICHSWLTSNVVPIFQLKDENGQLMGVHTSNLLIANSGNDLPVRNESAIYFSN